MKSLIKSILLATMFLTLGCTKQENEYYYSVSEIYKEIENNPDEIINFDSSSAYINFMGEIDKMSQSDLSFSLKEDDYELKCIFTNDTLTDKFYENHQVGDIVYLSGKIIENGNEYQAQITDIQ